MPDLLPGSDFYLKAFWELNSDRQIGMGMGPVPFAAIDRCALRFGIEGEDFDYFVRMIRAMDRVVLDRARDEAPRNGANSIKPKASARELTAEVFDAVFG